MNYFGQAAAYLIQTVFGLYILAVMLRLLLQMVRADFYNPLSQFLVRITNPPLKPLRRIVPGLLGIDLASVLLLLALKMMELTLTAIALGHVLRLPGLLVLALAGLLQLLIYIFLIGIIIQVILSWVRPGDYNPLTALLHDLTEPLLKPARRYIPPISGLDFSPVAVLIALQLLLMLVVAPLTGLGNSLA